VHWLLGYPERSALRYEAAFARARSLGHPFSLCQPLGAGLFFGRTTQEVAAWADELMAIAAEHGFPMWRAIALVARMWAGVETSVHDAGSPALRHGLDAIDEAGVGVVRVWAMARLVETLMRLAEFVEADKLLAEARAFMNRHRLLVHASELPCLQGELLLRRVGGHDAAAEICFRDALAAAQAQCARSLELRAATRLARLWVERGERRQAHDLLAPIYSWFTEGLDTADLVEARDLLAELC
jgi:hypothetical protein